MVLRYRYERLPDINAKSAARLIKFFGQAAYRVSRVPAFFKLLLCDVEDERQMRFCGRELFTVEFCV